MACYHPLRAAYLNTKADSGKRQVKVFGEANSDNAFVFSDGKGHYDFSSCYSFGGSVWHPLQTFSVPCGQCVGCRLDYSRKWATRLMLELPYHQTAYFVTLTYSDEFLPIGSQGIPTLDPNSVTDFMKRLRSNQSRRGVAENIRFYLAGEYGSQSARPHYHLILYDWIPPEDDLIFLKYSKSGAPYYRSLSLEKLWPYGFNVVCGVSWQSCAYVARYILKKQKGEGKAIYEQNGIESEFNRMSRNPGIAYQYYEEHASDMLRDHFVQLQDGLRAPVPRYFDPFFEEQYPEEYKMLSEDRKNIAKILQQVKEFSSELDYFEQLVVDEQVKEKKSKMLVRPDI